jgi:hypothetical protein
MERRTFVTSLMAGVATITAAPTVHAVADGIIPPSPTPGMQAPVHILVQAGLAPARDLAASFAASLTAAGITHTLSHEAALLDPARVQRLLARNPDARLIGVTDDASAVVVQALAASRGQTCVQHRQHRIDTTHLASFVIRL